MHRILKLLVSTLLIFSLFSACDGPVEKDKTPPGAIILSNVYYSENSFIFTWTQNLDDDFATYKLYDSPTVEMTDYELIYESETNTDTSFIYSDPKKGISSYFQVVVTDAANLNSWSNIVIGYGQNTFYATFGGTAMDFGKSVIETIDGGYAMLGSTFENGYYDMLLVKADTAGNEEWSKTFGGSGWDFGSTITKTSDNGFIISGYTASYGAGKDDIWLIKTDLNGVEEWNQTFGGEKDDKCFDVQETSDGGFILAGNTYSIGKGSSDGWLIKTNSAGTEEWSATFGDSAQDQIESVQQTPDGGFILAGHTNSYGNGKKDFWLIKCTSDGTEEWVKTFGGTDDDKSYSVLVTADGGYLVMGNSDSYEMINTNTNLWLVKTGPDGELEWDKKFGGADWDSGNDMQPTEDGNYIISGYTTSFGSSGSDVWLVKVDTNGNLIWTRIFGGPETDRGNSIKPTSDGGYIIAGDTDSYGNGAFDIWLLKTNPGGKIIPVD